MTPALIAAVAAASVVIAWAGQGLTYFNQDEWLLFTSADWDADYLLYPFFGQLMLATRTIFQLAFSTSGDDYSVVQGAAIAACAAPSIPFFLIARRRIGAAAALVPTLVLLFFGSAWEHMLWPFEATGAGICLAAGLGALLALEGEGRRRDLIACLLLCVAIFSFGIAFAFLAGVLVHILMRPDRWRRIWIAAVPLALYGAWFLWAQQFDYTTGLYLHNALLVPMYMWDSLGSTGAALAGLNFDFDLGAGFRVRPGFDSTWAPPIAFALIGGLAWRARLGRFGPWLWVALSILLVYWATAAMVLGAGTPSYRSPGLSRYLYPSAILLLLVLLHAADGWRPSRTVLIALFALAGLSIVSNLAELRYGSKYLRAYSDAARAQLAMIELARDTVAPEFDPAYDSPDASEAQLQLKAGDYLASVDRIGSPAYTIPDLLRRSEDVRHGADGVLIKADRLALEPTRKRGESDSCLGAGRGLGAFTQTLELPPGGATISSPATAEISLSRFSILPVELATLPAGRPSILRIAPDQSTQPWILHISGTAPVRACALTG